MNDDLLPDELDDDVDDADRDSLYLKYLFDGAPTLDDLAAILRSVADLLDERARSGWDLGEPVDGGWAHLVRTGVDL